MSPPAKLDLTQTQSELYLMLGRIQSDVTAIKERLEKGDERFENMAREQRELPCKLTSCPTDPRPGGWKAPTAYAAGGGAAVTILITISEILKAYIMKGN